MINVMLTCLVSIHTIGHLAPSFHVHAKLAIYADAMNHALDYVLRLGHSLIDIISWLLQNSNDVHPNPGPTAVDNITRELYISHINAQSLLSEISPNPVPYSQKYIKIDEIFKQQVCDKYADVIAVSETWLDDTISDADISLQDYTIFRRDRHRHGGGILVYVRETLPVLRRVDLEINGLETIWLEISLNCGNILVGSYYRPPGANEASKELFLTSFQSCIDTVFAENPIGDFNDRCKTFYSNHTDSELQNRLHNLKRNIRSYCETTV